VSLRKRSLLKKKGRVTISLEERPFARGRKRKTFHSTIATQITRRQISNDASRAVRSLKKGDYRRVFFPTLFMENIASVCV